MKLPTYNIFESQDFIIVATGEGEPLAYEVVQKNADSDVPARHAFIYGALAMQTIWAMSMNWRANTPTEAEVEAYLGGLLLITSHPLNLH